MEADAQPGPATPDPGEPPEAAEGFASVVFADPRDEIASVCGRIDAADTYAVVVHAPRGNRQLATELGMRRLARHAEDAGKTVAIATRSRTLSARARQVGIPVAGTPGRVRWDAGGHRVLRLGRWSLVAPAMGAYIQVAAIGLVVVILAGLALSMGPSVEVTVTPPTETLSETVVVVASPDRREADLAARELPAREVTVSQRFTLAIRSTGKAAVDTLPAAVLLTVTNNGQAAVSLPAGSAVIALPEDITFLLDAALTVPAATTVQAPATAARPGAKGNLAASRLTRFQDPTLTSLTVTNAAAASGGTTEERLAVGAADVVAIRAMAKDIDKSDIVKEAIRRARPGDAAILRTAKTAVTLGEPSGGAGTVADTLFLDIDVSVSVLAIPPDALERLALEVLGGRAGDGEFIPGSVMAVETGASQSASDDGSFRTEVRVSAEFARGLSIDEMRDAVKGKSTDDAKSILSQRYGIQDPEVSLSPGWAPRLPRFGFRVSVTLKAAAPPADAGATDANAISTETRRPATPTTTPGP
ncbi:MAG: baseplate J/gp47 family protein [Dehalococcoidia bacterium]